MKGRLRFGGKKQAWSIFAVVLAVAAGGTTARSVRVFKDEPGVPTPSVAPAASPLPSPSPTSPASPSLGTGIGVRTLPPGVPAGVQPGYVAKIVDGDTIWVEVRDPGPLSPAAVHKIRILEIDTPESTNKKDCFGNEAAAFAKRELPVGSKVYLLRDRQDRDRYGRYLRYVWTQNGEFYNEKIIREGLAKAVLYPPNDLYIGQMRAAETEARRSARGLWTACAGGQPSR